MSDLKFKSEVKSGSSKSVDKIVDQKMPFEAAKTSKDKNKGNSEETLEVSDDNPFTKYLQETENLVSAAEKLLQKNKKVLLSSSGSNNSTKCEKVDEWRAKCSSFASSDDGNKTKRDNFSGKKLKKTSFEGELEGASSCLSPLETESNASSSCHLYDVLFDDPRWMRSDEVQVATVLAACGNATMEMVDDDEDEEEEDGPDGDDGGKKDGEKKDNKDGGKDYEEKEEKSLNCGFCENDDVRNLTNSDDNKFEKDKNVNRKSSDNETSLASMKNNLKLDLFQTFSSNETQPHISNSNQCFEPVSPVDQQRHESTERSMTTLESLPSPTITLPPKNAKPQPKISFQKELASNTTGPVAESCLKTLSSTTATSSNVLSLSTEATKLSATTSTNIASSTTDITSSTVSTATKSSKTASTSTTAATTSPTEQLPSSPRAPVNLLWRKKAQDPPNPVDYLFACNDEDNYDKLQWTLSPPYSPSFPADSTQTSSSLRSCACCLYPIGRFIGRLMEVA